LPGLAALLDGAARRDFDLVICYDPDRLSRRLARYVIIEQELRQRGVGLRFVTVRAGDTPEDRALQNMKAVFAELDYERIILRLMRGRRAKAEGGDQAGDEHGHHQHEPDREALRRTGSFPRRCDA
jgi:site-specific DNA recombinase